MRKTLATLATTGVLALGGLSGAPQPANAVAWWVAPAIVGGVIVGGAAGAAANTYYAGPNGPGPYAYAPGYNAAGYAYAPGYYATAPRYYVPPQPYDAMASSEVYVEPRSCFWTRQRVAGGWARVRVCD